MKAEFLGAVPEIPMSNVDRAADYFRNNSASTWTGVTRGIAGISKVQCRMFLTNPAFREMYGNSGPVVVWLNLSSRQEVDDLHQQWCGSEAKIVSPPESKPWKLHEFTASDLDGNLLRVF